MIASDKKDVFAESDESAKGSWLLNPSGPDAVTSLSMLSKVVCTVSLTPELVAAVTEDLDPQRTFQYLTLPQRCRCADISN